MEKFQKAPFEEIAAHCESKVKKPTSKGRKPVKSLKRSASRNYLCLKLLIFFVTCFLQANMLHDRLAQIFELTIR